MTKQILINEQDQVYYQAVERFRRACDWSRIELIQTIAELAEQICDDDKDIIINKIGKLNHEKIE
ncbi:MAG: hypothetical protein GY705_24045 [Bacteroidetes bacterium]|nr:hypothetical protein [Bacteroidota bacterium]